MFPFLTIDADVGRQANEVFDEIAYLRLGNRLGQIVVIDTGSNGIVSADELDDLLEKLSDRRRVVLVTVHAPRLWQDPNNEIFAEAAERHPNTTLAGMELSGERASGVAVPRRHARTARVRVSVRGRSSGLPPSIPSRRRGSAPASSRSRG